MNSYCLTDIGIKRSMNQDFVYASEQPVGNLPNLFIVADGMGGHNAGDYASRLAVETMIDHIENSRETKPVRLLAEALSEANRTVYARSLTDRSLEGMGTTLVACSAVEDCLYIANIGDSRLYLIDSGIDQITRDHSLVEEMIRARQITREEARVHPDKNVITRAIGMKDEIKADLFDVGLKAGDICLLCSDGLSNMVTDEEIFELIQEAPSLEEAAGRLVEKANRNGGSDNISVVLVQPFGNEPDEGGV